MVRGELQQILEIAAWAKQLFGVLGFIGADDLQIERVRSAVTVSVREANVDNVETVIGDPNRRRPGGPVVARVGRFERRRPVESPFDGRLAADHAALEIPGRSLYDDRLRDPDELLAVVRFSDRIVGGRHIDRFKGHRFLSHVLGEIRAPYGNRMTPQREGSYGNRCAPEGWVRAIGGRRSIHSGGVKSPLNTPNAKVILRSNSQSHRRAGFADGKPSSGRRHVDRQFWRNGVGKKHRDGCRICHIRSRSRSADLDGSRGVCRSCKSPRESSARTSHRRRSRRKVPYLDADFVHPSQDDPSFSAHRNRHSGRRARERISVVGRRDPNSDSGLWRVLWGVYWRWVNWWTCSKCESSFGR